MSQIYCSNCGQLIPVNSNFCRFCGVPQHGENASLYRAQAEVVLPGSAPTTSQPVQKDVIQKAHLDRSVIFVFFANYLKSSSLLFPLLVVGIYFEPLIFSLITVVALALLLFVAILSYKNYTYEVTEDGLSIMFGIVHHKTISVPYDQVQNVNIERSVFDRILGLARVSIETAGSAQTQPIHVIGGYAARSEAYVPGLSIKKAMILHDILIDGKIDERT